MSNVDPNAILRGAQLTLVGAYRALQNPTLFQSAHYRQALKAVLLGILIRLLISLPIYFVRVLLFVLSFVIDLSSAQWDDTILSSLEFLETKVLQLPLFVMGLMRYLVPTLDEVFMLSLRWVDGGLVVKHVPAVKEILVDAEVVEVGKSAAVGGGGGGGGGGAGAGVVPEAMIVAPDGKRRRPLPIPIPEEVKGRLYWPTLSLYPPHAKPLPPPRPSGGNVIIPPKPTSPLRSFLHRSVKKGALSLLIYLLTFLPRPIGPLILPLSTLYSLHKFLGLLPSLGISLLCLLLLPKPTSILLLQTYFSSRTLTRELLEPYFSRLPFTSDQKRRWFRDREGLLFGFGVGFLLLVRLKLVGVLAYGIAEGSTAYLITKITDPVPPPPKGVAPIGAGGPETKKKWEWGVDPEGEARLREWCESQTVWRNKKQFLSMPAEIVGLVQGWWTKLMGPSPEKSTRADGVNGEELILDDGRVGGGAQSPSGLRIPGGFESGVRHR